MSDRIASVTAIDTSVIVPGLLFWHEKHEAASAALVQLLESGNEVVLPLHSLVEAYAVMTRLPPPHRDLLQNLSHRNLVGGTSYDSLILA